MSSSETEINIFHGDRGNDFKNLIFNLLKKSKLKEKYIDLLLDNESMKIYDHVFTSITADIENNYEVYEQLGDISANKFIVWYMYRRFPQLKCSKGVKIVARLRINYGAKQSFAPIAENLGFWPYISASEDERSRNKKSLLEDTFEAFIGAIEYIVDSRLRQCAGYSIIYEILSNIFNEIKISLNYEDLYDCKTRLKELFDFYTADVIGIIKYETVKDLENKLNTTIVYQIHNQKRCNLGEGIASLKADSEQKAAYKAIEYLKSKVYTKPIPDIYAFFNNRNK